MPVVSGIASSKPTTPMAKALRRGVEECAGLDKPRYYSTADYQDGEEVGDGVHTKDAESKHQQHGSRQAEYDAPDGWNGAQVDKSDWP